MKLSHVLPLAALSTAFVIPPAEVLDQIAIEDNHRGGNSWADRVADTKDEVVAGFKSHFHDVAESSKDAWVEVMDSGRNAIDVALERGNDLAGDVNERLHDTTAFDVESWLGSAADDVAEFFDDGDHHGKPEHDGPPPHDGKPKDGPPHHGPPKDGKPPHHGPPKDGKPPHHGPPHHGGKPNLTVYELISKSKYTTKLAKLIDEYDDIVEALNSTKANYTIFAPTDKAFEKIPKHAPKPSKEQLKKILEYHISPDFYPAGRVLATHTVPTLLKSDSLAAEPKPQRLSFHVGLKGLTINFYARIVAVDIFGTNGVIHGVDSIILPPPSVIKIIDLLPTEFSTLELGLGKTGLIEKLNTTDHHGGTFFAPSNFAFQKLGPKINAFLFSTYGQKYLKALLEYHLVPDNTLYSDAYYGTEHEETMGVPKGYFHVDLPTMLEDRSLSINIARYGGLIEIKINAFARVTIQDGIAEDGVIQVVSDVLVPPKKVGGPGGSVVAEFWDGSEMTVEELSERLEPFVAKSDL